MQTTSKITRDETNRITKRFEPLWQLVGNTPMIAIHYAYKGRTSVVYAKCEHYNLTGSIKDRMALYILQKAYEEQKIKPGDLIVEATSGNTGISFAAIGKALGHEVTIIMPDWLSRERMDIIQSLGAEVLLVSREAGGFSGSIQLAEQMAALHKDVFLPRQFENKHNAAAHEATTAREIWTQLAAIDKIPQAFAAGVGTGGTVMGMRNFLKRKDPLIQVHPIEPAESPTLSTGHKTGSHRIQGISDEFIPAIVDLSTLDEVIPVSDGDAILMAQKMASELGLAVGISSGANIVGAIKVQQYLGHEAVVVTVLPDSNKKYLSTDLVREEPVKESYISSRVNLLGYVPVKRPDSKEVI